MKTDRFLTVTGLKQKSNIHYKILKVAADWVLKTKELRNKGFYEKYQITLLKFGPKYVDHQPNIPWTKTSEKGQYHVRMLSARM